MAVLVLGAYGLIGQEISAALLAAGHQVQGLGRSKSAALSAFPDIAWHIADLRQMQATELWLPLITGCEAVVNCAGALQDGPRDDLAAVHFGAMNALAQACAQKGTKLVQISAVGTENSASPFMASKAQGDAAIRASGCEYVILRPGLVLAQSAYGGTALLRLLAALPLVQLQAMGDAKVQCVAASDVASAVCAAIAGELPERFEADLVELERHSLSQVQSAMRAWLGFAPARLALNLPLWLARIVSRGADMLGHLGWRGPLRRAALDALEQGVTGDDSAWRAAGQPPLKSLHETLGTLRADASRRAWLC